MKPTTIIIAGVVAVGVLFVAKKYLAPTAAPAPSTSTADTIKTLYNLVSGSQWV